MAALQGLPVSRVPVGPLAVHYCAGLAGYSLRQYTTAPRCLVESVLKYYERFRPDAIWVSADTWVTAEAMGAKVGAVGDQQPFGGLGQPLVQTVADIDRIPAPDIGCQGRCPLMLEALERIVRELQQQVFIVACFDQYPFSLAAALMGINELMLKVHDDPPFVAALMARCEEYALAYGAALGRAGADLLSGGDSPAVLVGPKLYEQMVLPAEANLIRQLKSIANKPVSLHICGNTTRILSRMAASGADVLELDHAVDLGIAGRLVDPGIAIWGNLDPVGVLARGTPEVVTAAAGHAMAAMKTAGHSRFVLSSGCTLAMETPVANLDALLGASAGWKIKETITGPDPQL